MTDKDLLLQSILKDPEDLLARAAYADALEEEGDQDTPHFIRTQLAKRDKGVTCVVRRRPHEDAPVARVKTKHHPFDRDWLQQYLTSRARCLCVHDARLRLRKGFVHNVVCGIRGWMAFGKRLVRNEPVRHVEVRDRNPSFTHVTTQNGGLHVHLSTAMWVSVPFRRVMLCDSCGEYAEVGECGECVNCRDADPSVIPYSILRIIHDSDHLQGVMRKVLLDDRAGSVLFQDGESAHKALSYGCLKWAREEIHG